MILVFCLSVALPAWSQIDLLKKARKKTEERTEKEADKKIDEGLDMLFGKKKKPGSESTSGEATVQPASSETETAGSTGGAATTPTTQATESPSGVLNWAK